MRRTLGAGLILLSLVATACSDDDSSDRPSGAASTTTTESGGSSVGAEENPTSAKAYREICLDLAGMDPTDQTNDEILACMEDLAIAARTGNTVTTAPEPDGYQAALDRCEADGGYAVAYSETEVDCWPSGEAFEANPTGRAPVVYTVDG